MNWLLDILDRLRAAYRARRSAQALADLQRGADILNKAQAEAADMAAAQASLDASLSTTPTVPATAAPVAPAVRADAAPMPPPVPGGVASSPEDITARIRKP